MGYISISITVPDNKTASKITKLLIENKLVSCVSIMPKMKSVYWWKNKVCRKNEMLLILKSVKKNLKKIVSEVKKTHPYKIPEIVCFDITGGNKNYLDWIKENTIK